MNLPRSSIVGINRILISIHKLNTRVKNLERALGVQSSVSKKGPTKKHTSKSNLDAYTESLCNKFLMKVARALREEFEDAQHQGRRKKTRKNREPH